MTIDLEGVPASDPQADMLREIDGLMGERYEVDERARAGLVPVLREYARLSRDLHRRLSGLRAGEIDRFDRTLDRIGDETGLVPDVRPDPDRRLADMWDLMDELDSCELTLIGRAEDCELLAALIAHGQRIELDGPERRALERRRLGHELSQAYKELAEARKAYSRARDSIVRGDDPAALLRDVADCRTDLDDEAKRMHACLDASKRCRRALDAIESLRRRIRSLEEE